MGINYTYQNRASESQLGYAASLLRKAGFDIREATPEIMIEQGLAFPEFRGEPTNDWLEDLTKREISKVIDWLKNRIENPVPIEAETEIEFTDEDFDFLDC